jgi:homoserine kinase
VGVKGGASASSKDDEVGAMCASGGGLGSSAAGAVCGVAVMWNVKASEAVERLAS